MKRSLSLLIISSIVLAGLSGCSVPLGNADTDDIIAAASEISDLIIDRDEIRLPNRIDGRYQIIGSSMIFDDDEPDEGSLQVRNAIADTMDYCVVEDSCEAISSTEGTVDVVFSFADYSKVLEEQSFSNGSDASDAISDCGDRIEITVNMDLVYKDDDWKLYNFDVIPTIFPFDSEVFTFAMDIRDMITDSYWDEAEDDVYTNSPRLRYVMQFDPEKTGDTISYSYQFTYEGEILEESDVITDNTPDEVVILYTCGQDGQDFLPVGSYTITVFDEGGNEILTDECSALYEATWAEMSTYDVEDLGLRFTLPSGFKFLPPNDYYYSYIYGDYDNVIFVAVDYDYEIFISVILYDDMRNMVTMDSLDSYVETMADMCNDDAALYDDPEVSDYYYVSRVDLAGMDLPALDEEYSTTVDTYLRYIYIPCDEGMYEISVMSTDPDDLVYYTENFWEVIDQ